MQSKNDKKIPEDEIDLRSVTRKIYLLFSYPFLLLFSNLIITFCFLIAAILASIGFKYISQKTYTSSFIIHPIDRHETIHLKMLSDIKVLLKYKDYEAISKELKIDSAISKKIIAIETSNASLKHPVDSANNTEIKITTSDYHQFIPIQSALLTYLENNPYFAKIKMLQTKQVEMELEQVEKDMVQLDSLKMIQLRTLGKQNVAGQNSFLLHELIDPTKVYRAQTDLINTKSALLARSKFFDNFQLIKSCIVIRQYTSPPRLLIICLYTIPVFLFFCFLILHFKSRKSYNTPDITDTIN